MTKLSRMFAACNGNATLGTIIRDCGRRHHLRLWAAPSSAAAGGAVAQNVDATKRSCDYPSPNGNWSVFLR